MNIGKNGEGGPVAVAVDKDKGSQYALRWAVDNLLTKGQSLSVIHVKINNPNVSNPSITENSDNGMSSEQIKELFLPFRCYCTRKEIQCKDVILEDNDVAKAITEYVAQFAIENLVIGASTKSSFLRRLKNQDLSVNISKGAPDFCNVYVISKGKVTSLRPAIRVAPAGRKASNIQLNYRSETSIVPSYRSEHAESSLHSSRAENDSMSAAKSSFARTGRLPVMRRGSEVIVQDIDTSISNNRRSTDKLFPPSMGDHFDTARNGRSSNASSIDADSMCSDRPSFQSPLHHQHMSVDIYYSDIEYSSSDPHSISSWSSHSQTQEDLEAEMRRLKLELKQTMDMYSNACKEALTAKQKAVELHRWKIEEQQRLEEARLAEEAALALAEKEKAKCKAALEAAEAAQRIAELESQKRKHAEMKAIKESEEKKKALDALANTDIRCRKYSIEEIEAATESFSQGRKIGEGGYGPVYKCYLDHTEVAVKVLRPDAAQGRMQFQQEVEVLSCIRHPNMVLLLGACPEYGCLVYDYMHNGSLEDRLLRRGNTPPLSWQLRFRIAAEIGTGLLFLHQTKPEPLVHRDLKPANILLDRNFVSKISDVGLARLVPPSVVNDVTQYRMTSTAGTFCYIDPEYQQTGMLGVKSDVYSLGIMLLQIITAKPAMGLTHHVERSIEKGTFAEMLDPSVPDWPVEEALTFAKMALRCAELRRKDRPDLGTVVLPELNRLRAIADENMAHYNLVASANSSPVPSLAMMRSQEVISSYTLSSAFTNHESLKSHSSTSSASMFGRRAY